MMSTMETISADCARDGEMHRLPVRARTVTIAALLGWFGHAMLKRRTRIHLSELSNDLLNDIGIAPAEARREVKRFFWD
ncbi:MAG: DUF1127 domain-containing protein [Phyllobacterium sp.]|uniref:DUF1127 domain-containing protein n=1 Tax=Phyllobacterium sp. TaxID=1871046 RepID=UPI0030F338B3